jgi:hypothetical protein
MNEEEKKKRREQIIAALQNKIALGPCPRCHSSSFALAGETAIPLGDNPGKIWFGGPVVPTVIVACTNCGHLMLHASITLGVPLPKGDDTSGQ